MTSQFLFKLQMSNDKAHTDSLLSEPLKTEVREQIPLFRRYKDVYDLCD